MTSRLSLAAASPPQPAAVRRRHPARPAAQRLRRSPAAFAAKARGFGSSSKQAKQSELCPCGSSTLPYSRCCKPYHKGKAAETPRRLLETRFSGYAKGIPEYIVETAVMPDSTEDVETLVKDIRSTCDKLNFVSLRVLEEAEDPSGSHAVIKFRYSVRTVGQKGFRQGKLEEIEETSHFLKSDGRWLFNEGTTDRNPAKA